VTTASTRIWTFAAVFLMVLVIALGWFLGASPRLADAARFDDERRDVVAQNDLARVTIAQLESDFQQIEDLRDELRELRSQFPTGADYDVAVEEFLRGMIAEELVLQNVAISEPSPTSAVAVPEDEQVEPEVDGEGQLPTGSLLRVPVSVTVGGPLDAILAFIERLQVSPRFSVIPTGTFSEGTNAEVQAMTFQLVMYVVTGDELPEVEPTAPPATEESAPDEPTPEEPTDAGP
jgi:hypothetical protein